MHAQLRVTDLDQSVFDVDFPNGEHGELWRHHGTQGNSSENKKRNDFGWFFRNSSCFVLGHKLRTRVRLLGEGGWRVLPSWSRVGHRSLKVRTRPIKEEYVWFWWKNILFCCSFVIKFKRKTDPRLRMRRSQCSSVINWSSKVKVYNVYIPRFKLFAAFVSS